MEKKHSVTALPHEVDVIVVVVVIDSSLISPPC